MNKSLTIENLNPRIAAVEYAVRGPIVTRAVEIEKEMKSVLLYLLLALQHCSFSGQARLPFRSSYSS